MATATEAAFGALTDGFQSAGAARKTPVFWAASSSKAGNPPGSEGVQNVLRKSRAAPDCGAIRLKPPASKDAYKMGI